MKSGSRRWFVGYCVELEIGYCVLRKKGYYGIPGQGDFVMPGIGVLRSMHDGVVPHARAGEADEARGHLADIDGQPDERNLPSRNLNPLVPPLEVSEAVPPQPHHGGALPVTGAIHLW